MKIRFKITLFTSLFLVFMVTALTLISVKDIRVQGEEKISTYKKEELQQVKNHLKDLVDIAYETVDINYKNLSSIDYLRKFYERKSYDSINSVETIIKRYKNLARSGRITLAEAKNKAKTEISEIRYDNGAGYIWINDIGKPYPKMIMHPTIPALNGKLLSSPKYKNALGTRKNLFVAIVEAT